jgi:hypothetical protein
MGRIVDLAQVFKRATRPSHFRTGREYVTELPG